MNALLRSLFRSVPPLLALSACAGLLAPPVTPGQSEADVVARLGRPTNVYPVADGRLLEYMHGPMGQTTDMVKIGPDGRLQSFEQVLTMEKFAVIVPDQTRQEQVLRTVGRPAERSRVAMRNYEVWSYRYREAGVWNSLMHVHFDGQGVVRQMMNAPDPMYEPRDRFGF